MRELPREPMTRTIAVNTLAVMLAAGLNDEDLELAAVLLNQLGDTLGTIAAQRRRGGGRT